MVTCVRTTRSRHYAAFFFHGFGELGINVGVADAFIESIYCLSFSRYAAAPPAASQIGPPLSTNSATTAPLDVPKKFVGLK